MLRECVNRVDYHIEYKLKYQLFVVKIGVGPAKCGIPAVRPRTGSVRLGLASPSSLGGGIWPVHRACWAANCAASNRFNRHQQRILSMKNKERVHFIVFLMF